MPGKSPFLKKIASWPVKAMTSRYPRLGDVTRAARSALNGPPLPDIDWITAPIRMQRSPLEKVRLNCLISTIDPAKAWAGNMMTTELFESLRPHFDSARILVFDQTTPAQLARFPSFRPVSRGEESDEPLQIVAMPESQDRPLPVGTNDVLITSHFSHAYRCINQIIPWQVREFGRAPGPMVYLIQDFEPGFWPWSSEYLLAESTYRAPNPVVAVFSSSILRDYFRGQNYTFFKEYSFEPKLNSVLRANHFRDGSPPAKKRQILLYGRPWIPRNAFAVAEAGLRVWRARFPDAHRWSVISRGEPHADIDLGGGVVMKSVGKTGLEEYARILSESSIGLSLMVSPHPSFPPLEMVHFGIMTITNRFANKDLSLFHDNFISIDDARPESIADQLVTLCRRFESDPASGYRGESRMPHYLDGTPTFPFADELADNIRSSCPGV